MRTYRLPELKIHSKTYHRQFAGIPPTEYCDTQTFLAHIDVVHPDGYLSWVANGMFSCEDGKVVFDGTQTGGVLKKSPHWDLREISDDELEAMRSFCEATGDVIEPGD